MRVLVSAQPFVFPVEANRLRPLQHLLELVFVVDDGVVRELQEAARHRVMEVGLCLLGLRDLATLALALHLGLLGAGVLEVVRLGLAFVSFGRLVESLKGV